MAQAFTAEQVLALAPDAASASAGKGLATARKWASLGFKGDAIWGECQGSGKDPYRARVDLNEPAFKCSCPSRKFPCKHGLGVLLLWANSASSFTECEPPAWVAEWLDSRATRAAKKAERTEERAQKEADPAAQAKRAERRESRVAAGVDELETWLRDLARRGLAAAKSEPAEFWNRMAARLVDAQATGLARYVRSLSDLCASGEGWQDRALRQAGRLHLLVRAWKRIDSLPPELREEVRALVGFVQSKEEVLSQPGVRDQWFAWAQYVDDAGDGLRVQRTWLFGTETGRTAMALAFARPGMPFEFSFMPGRAHAAELAFYPSSVPRRVLEKSRGEASDPPTKPAFANIESAFAAYGADLARNPWIEAFPMAVREARLAFQADRFLLVDAENRSIAVRATAEAMWRAYAATGGRPATFFGEWDETALDLLAFDADGIHSTTRT